MIIVLVVATPLISPRASAQPSYTPGVKVGDSVTLGQISATWKSNSPPPDFIRLFNQTASIKETVTTVDLTAKTVSATQTFTFKNGTSGTGTIAGNVQTGEGNLSIWLIAGHLSAGDPPTQSLQSSGIGIPIGETVARFYAGAVRSTNLLSISVPQYGFAFNFYYDAVSGYLLEANYTVANLAFMQSGVSGSASIYLKLTNTNIWQTSGPDFSLDATSPPTGLFSAFPVVYRGDSASYRLNITSFNGFSGTVAIASATVNSTVSHPPLFSVSPASVGLTLGKSATSLFTISTDASTTTGLYLVSVTGTGGSLTHEDQMAFYVAPPDFAIFATPSNLTVASRGMKTSTITVRALGLFTGTISLSTSPSTPVLTASLSSTSAVLSSTVKSVNSTLTLTAQSYAVPGDYSVYVYGATTYQRSVYIPVTVAGPDFQFSAVSSLTAAAGSTVSTTVALNSIGGFSGTVGLSAVSDSGFAVTLSPTSVSVSPSSSPKSTLTVSVPVNTPAGGYSVTVTGVDGIQSHSTHVSITVPGPDFSISASPNNFVTQPGKGFNSTITLTSVSGFTGIVTLAATVARDLGYVFSSTQVTVPAGGSATSKLTLSLPSTVLPTNYEYANVHATSGLLYHQAYVSFQPSRVIPVGTPDFYVSTNPSSLTLTPGTRGNSTVTLTSLNGFHDNVSLTAFLYGGNPGTCPGVNCPILSLTKNILSLTAGGSVNSTLTMTVPATTPVSSYVVYIEANSVTVAGYTHFGYVDLTVAGPDFGVDTNVPSMSLVSGGSGTPTVILRSFLGLSGSISLTASIGGAPSGTCTYLTCPSISFIPSSVTLPADGTATSQMLVTTVSTTLPGYYAVEINATMGNLFHTATFSITVLGGDIGISANPSTLVLAPGGSGPASVFVASLDGFSGNVTLTANGNPSLSSTFVDHSFILASGGTQTYGFTISAPSTTGPGYYYYQMSAANGSLYSSTSVNVLVAAPDFGLDLNSYYLTVQAGKQDNVTFTIPSLDGFKGTVSLSAMVSGGSFGVCPGPNCPTATFSTANPTLARGGWAISNMTVSVPSNASPGNYYVSVTSTNGTIYHYAYLTVNVPQPPASLVSVVVGVDGGIYWSRFVSSWSTWNSLSGYVSTPPAICSGAPGQVELIVKGNDNGIYHKSFFGGAWSPTWDTPGGFTRDQSACAVLNNIMYVVVRGTDNGLYWNSMKLATSLWSGWSSLEGFTLSSPTLVSTSTQARLDLVIRGTDNGIYHKAFVAGAWSPSWDSPGGFTRDVPALVSDGFNINLVVRGMDNSTYYNQMSFGGSWSGWVSLSGFISSAPVLVVDASGIIHLVVRGTNNGIYHKERSLAGTWSTAWDSPGGFTVDRPGEALLGSSLVLLARGADNGIYYASLSGSTWSSWIKLSGKTPAAPGLLAS